MIVFADLAHCGIGIAIKRVFSLSHLTYFSVLVVAFFFLSLRAYRTAGCVISNKRVERSFSLHILHDHLSTQVVKTVAVYGDDIYEQ